MAEDMLDDVELHPDVHHEESDISTRAVLIGVAITAVFFIVMVIGLRLMYIGFRAVDRKLDPEVPTRVVAPAAVSPGVPEFRTHWSEPAKYLEEIHKEDRAILDQYGWVDRSAGRVHVPIEVGMEMALERGYPTREGASGEAAETGSEESRKGSTQ